MSIFTRIHNFFSRDATQQTSLHVVKRAPVPFFNGYINIGDLKASLEQAAIRDAQIPTDDLGGIEDRKGHLIYETQIISDLNQRAADADLDFLEADRINREEIFRIQAQGAHGRPISELQAMIGKKIEERDQLEQERYRPLVDVLIGATPDPWDRLMTGEVPDTASSLRFHWVGQIALSVLGILESLLGYQSITIIVTDDRDVLLRTLLGVLAAICLFALPVIIGNIFKGVANPPRPPKPREVVASWSGRIILIIIWLVLILSMTLLRTQQTLTAEESVQVSPITLVTTPSFIVLSLMMFIAGLAILWIHAKENPYQDAVITENKGLKKIDKQIRRLGRERDESQMLLEMTRDLGKANREIHEKYKKNIVRLTEELIDFYRQIYVREIKDRSIAASIADLIFASSPHAESLINNANPDPTNPDPTNPDPTNPDPTNKPEPPFTSFKAPPTSARDDSEGGQ